MYNSIASRSACAKVAQLRTGHCGLNNYLHRFRKRNSPYCECGYGKETVVHFMLECRKYKVQRMTLKREVGIGRMKMETLLGDVKMIKHTVEYINATNRLN